MPLGLCLKQLIHSSENLPYSIPGFLSEFRSDLNLSGGSFGVGPSWTTEYQADGGHSLLPMGTLVTAGVITNWQNGHPAYQRQITHGHNGDASEVMYPMQTGGGDKISLSGSGFTLYLVCDLYETGTTVPINCPIFQIGMDDTPSVRSVQFQVNLGGGNLEIFDQDAAGNFYSTQYTIPTGSGGMFANGHGGGPGILRIQSNRNDGHAAYWNDVALTQINTGSSGTVANITADNFMLGGFVSRDFSNHWNYGILGCEIGDVLLCDANHDATAVTQANTWLNAFWSIF